MDEVSHRALAEAARIRNDVAAAELIAALDAAGIQSILLKGPSIARWLYDEDEEEVRSYGDVDLLVSPREFGRAEAVAATLGFRHLDFQTTRIGRESHAETWFRESDGVRVELHRSFLGIGVPDQEFWDALVGKTEPFALGFRGVHAEVLELPARTLIVALHAADHGGGTPLKDLDRALERVSEQTWEDAAMLARRLRADAAFAVGLSLAPPGAELAKRLGFETRASAEILLRAAGPPPTALGWEYLARAGLRERLAYLFSVLAPSPDTMRLGNPLAQRGMAGLAAAYVLRPFRLARRAPRGLRAWRDARDRARS